MKSEEDLWNEEQEKAPVAEKASKRLAVQNLDWDQITAKDLLAIFNSLCREGGHVEKVEIHFSQFGKDHMVHDSLYGPQGIWKQGQASVPADDKKSSDKEDEDPEPQEDVVKPTAEPEEVKVEAEKKEEKEESEGAESDKPGSDLDLGPELEPERKDDEPVRTKKGFDPVALRRYELQKLKYFYGVVYCDSVETAEYIYNEYDGFEYEDSSLKLDLRFIPDDLVFPFQPKEVCDKVEPNYQPKVKIVNSAVQQSSVKLTWEAPDPKRFELITKSISPEKLEEMDLKDYLADEDEDQEEDGDKKEEKEKKNKKHETDAERYRKLLSGTTDDKTGGRKQGKSKADDLVISFKAGLEEDIPESGKKEWRSGKRAEEEAEEEGENGSENEEAEDEDENDEEKPARKTKKEGHKKNKGKRKEELETEESKELALLIDSKKPMENFKFDTKDPRFGALYQDKRYLIDPSSKDYKKASKDLIKEQVKRKKVEEDAA
ncbi:MAG: hypothetical protein P4L67_02265 [Candidatus Pacebacteria bacterium]|nr:hypothetical protein [Candidatus Paceibacterota bacterium]